MHKGPGKGTNNDARNLEEDGNSARTSIASGSQQPQGTGSKQSHTDARSADSAARYENTRSKDEGGRDASKNSGQGGQTDGNSQTGNESNRDMFKGPGKNNKDDTRKVEEGGKGSRKRIDSALRTRQGTGGDESMIMNSQKGLSNAPTMHSTDQMKNPDQSKKSEGLPDSAKYPGTVDPYRKAV